MVVKAHVSALPFVLAAKVRKGSSGDCLKSMSSALRTPIATGMTANSRIVCFTTSIELVCMPGCAFRIKSPSVSEAHWNSCIGAVSSDMLDPILKASHLLMKLFHTSSSTPMSILGRSSFGWGADSRVDG